MVRSMIAGAVAALVLPHLAAAQVTIGVTIPLTGPANHMGLDGRATAIIEVVDNKWKLAP